MRLCSPYDVQQKDSNKSPHRSFEYRAKGFAEQNVDIVHKAETM